MGRAPCMGAWCGPTRRDSTFGGSVTNGSCNLAVFSPCNCVTPLHVHMAGWGSPRGWHQPWRTPSVCVPAVCVPVLVRYTFGNTIEGGQRCYGACLVALSLFISSFVLAHHVVHTGPSPLPKPTGTCCAWWGMVNGKGTVHGGLVWTDTTGQHIWR